MTEDEDRLALERLDPLWEELFLAEQARIIHLLVDRVGRGAPEWPGFTPPVLLRPVA